MYIYVSIGDSLLISGPYGYLSAEKICSTKILILIAAGSGIFNSDYYVHVCDFNRTMYQGSYGRLI